MNHLLFWIKFSISSMQWSAVTQTSLTDSPSRKTSQSRPCCLIDRADHTQHDESSLDLWRIVFSFYHPIQILKNTEHVAKMHDFPNGWSTILAMIFDDFPRGVYTLDWTFMLEVCLWQPLHCIPCWLTENYWWWLDHDGYRDASRAARLLSEIILDSLLSGGGRGRSNKAALEEQEVHTLHLFQWPSHRLFGLNLIANPFWLHLAVQRKRSITTAKWENNLAAQHQLWSIHLGTTWQAGRDETVLA